MVAHSEGQGLDSADTKDSALLQTGSSAIAQLN
jgi:hypothetical protein